MTDKDISQGIENVREAITKMLVPVMREAIKQFSKSLELIMGTYPNNRVKNLAFHHKKRRVRKKNFHRMMNKREWEK